MAIKVLELDVMDREWPTLRVEGCDGLRILVRRGGRPVGWASIAPCDGPVRPAEFLRESVTRQLGRELAEPVLEELPTAGDPPPISVVVCTRDRTDLLEGCLEAILVLDYPDYEILVVDNAPRGDGTVRLAARLPVRYVREDRPGLNWARNRGVAEAHHGIIAFTDDDARPDRLWLRALHRAFSQPGVMAAMGFVAPVELETRAQALFEIEYGGMGHGFRSRTINRDRLTTSDLAWASGFGVGANMAFRREIFAEIGGFDVALDVGTPSGGGGDVEMFHRVVARGYTLLYDPAILVWHRHRREDAALRRLMFDNGRSFGAYLLTCIRNRTLGWPSALCFFGRRWLGGWIIRRLIRPRGFPRHLILTELWGTMISPVAYVTSRAMARRVAAAARPEGDQGAYQGTIHGETTSRGG
jgi:GT2 family glycosyltransferase